MVHLAVVDVISRSWSNWDPYWLLSDEALSLDGCGVNRLDTHRSTGFHHRSAAVLHGTVGSGRSGGTCPRTWNGRIR